MEHFLVLDHFDRRYPQRHTRLFQLVDSTPEKQLPVLLVRQ
jgi:hypothetical protein